MRPALHYSTGSHRRTSGLGEKAFCGCLFPLLLPVSELKPASLVLLLGESKGGRISGGDKPVDDMRLSFNKDGLPVPCPTITSGDWPRD